MAGAQPLGPTDWKLIYDGKSGSLDPSIGNWNFPCQSHYWIQHDRVRWAGRWSQQEIEAGRAADLAAKATYFGDDPSPPARPAPTPVVAATPDLPATTSKPTPKAPKPTWWRRLRGWLSGS